MIRPRQSNPMRVGAFLLLALSVAPGPDINRAAGDPDPARGTGSNNAPRGPYILHQIFGDLPQTSAAIWGVTPGVSRREIPAARLGREVTTDDGPSAFLKEVAGRVSVIFVFDGSEPESRLDHVTITLFEAPRLTPKAFVAHLSRIYGPPEPTPPGDGGETVATWQGGAVSLRHFQAAHFFEVTLTGPRSRV